jgi:hypothetical protein
MGRISQYPLDTDIQGNDKWIGTSVVNANATKNFSVDSVVEYINSSSGIESQALRYTYQNVQGDDVRLASTISFMPSLGDNVPFEDITEWVISAFAKQIKDVRTYYEAPLVGKTILITNAFNPSNWAIYRWDSVVEDIDDPNFYHIGLTYIQSTGELVAGQDYLIALLDASSGGGGSAIWGDITGTISAQTDLQNALNAKVPYTGATGNVDLGEFELKAGQVEFDQTPTGAAGVAVMRWNDTDGTVDLGLKGGNVTLQIGQEQVARVVNKTGASLLEANYQVVKVDGAIGNRLQVMLAQANNDANSAETLGIVTETIADNQEGFITTSGLVRNINTTGSLQSETWADGDMLYLSGSVAGQLTNVKPTAPIHTVIMGYVVRAHATQGQIYVKVDNGYELGELHNVNVNSAVDKDLIQYNSSTQLWNSVSLSGAGIQPTLVSGTNIKTINGTSLLGSGNIVISASATWGSITGTLSSQTDLQSALNAKQATLVSGTNIKTINSTTLLGSGDIAVQATLVSGTNIKTVNGTSLLGSGDITIGGSAAWGSITGTLSAQTDLQTALNGKQATLVSATNIKTINGSSILGSGDLVVSAGASGVAGAVQFSNGSGLASDATNLFWDDTNNRFGIGLNTPLHPFHLQGAGNTSATFSFRAQNNANTDYMRYRDDGVLQIYNSNTARTGTWDGYDLVVFRLGRAGQGQINLDGEFALRDETGSANLRIGSTDSRFVKGLGINTSGANVASAAFQVDGTTKGLLPPRMTTVQKNAIASPAAGLIVYDTTTNKLCCYNGTIWNDLF